VVEDSLQVGSLFVGEGTARAERSAGTVLGQGVEAAGAVGRGPAADGFAGEAEEFGDLGFGVA
jgi:hypothetical protein